MSNGATAAGVIATAMMEGAGFIANIVQQVNAGRFQASTIGPILRAEAQEEPCLQAAVMRELHQVGLIPAFQAIQAQINGSLEWTEGAIRYSIQNKGKNPAARVVGSRRLAEYAFSQIGWDLIPLNQQHAWKQTYLPWDHPNPNWDIHAEWPNPQPWTKPEGRIPPFGRGTLAMFQWIDDHMPTGQALADGSWRDEIMNFDARASGPAVAIFESANACRPGHSSGCWIRSREKLSPAGGVWLVPGNRTTRSRPGTKYRGSRIRAVIEEWIELQIETVADRSYPVPRRLLTDMVGSWRGSGPYGMWAWGDPRRPGSSLAAWDSMIEEWDRVYQTALLRCAEMTGLEVDAVQSGLSDAEAERLRKAKRESTLQFAILGGLALGALTLGRKK